MLNLQLQFKKIVGFIYLIINRYGFYITLALSLFVACVIRFHYQPLAIVGWDEAGHSEYVYWTVDAVRSQSWTQLAYIARYTIEYPMLFTLIMALPMLVTGPSMQTIRLINLIFYVISVILIFAVSIKITGHAKRIVALFASVLFLFSPMAIAFATIALTEMIGTTFTLLVAYLYVIRPKRNIFNLFLISISLIMLTMIRYNYGIIILMAMMINEGIEFLFKPNRLQVVYKVLIITIPYLLYMFWWIFIFQNNLSKFLYIIRNTTSYLVGVGSTWDHLIFYPASIIFMYSPSVLVGTCVFVAFIIGFWRLKESNLRFIWLLFTTNLVIAMTHTNNMQERYIFTVIPFIFIFGITVLLDISKNIYVIMNKIHLSSLVNLLVILVIGICLNDLIKLPEYVYAVGAYAFKTPLFNQNEFNDLLFDYDTKKWNFPVPPLSAEKPDDVFYMIAESVDLSKPVNVIGEANEFSQPYRNIVFADIKRQGLSPKLNYSEYVVIIDVFPDSKFYSRDYKIQNEWKMQNRINVEKDPSWRLIKTKIYESLKVGINIYAR
jgi:hypothetical protein